MMELTVKTLTGKMFTIQVDPSSTIGSVKEVIFAANAEFTTETQKLIHAGKVLKDDQILSDCGVKEKDFLVVMVTKPKKPAAVAAPPAGAAAEPAPAPAAAAAAPTPAAAAAPPAAVPAPAAPAAPAAPIELNAAELSGLTDMGFPEAEARAALEAATRVGGGQPLAVEFLMNGIPPNFPPAGTPMPAAPAGAAPAPAVPGTAAPSPGGAAPTAGGTPPALAALRQHPQFNQMRQLVQENPAALEPLLQQIGAQSPGLLDAIRANTAEFLAMLNEPVAPGGMQGMTPSGMPGMPGGAGQPTPAQLAQIFQGMPAEERARIAQQFGMSPEQFTQMTQMMAQMSPEQLQQIMGSMPPGMGMPGLAPGGGPGGAPPGAHVIQLTQDEAQAVQRLQQLGFSQQEAAEAYLACDKNEEMAANFLFDGGGGGGWGGMDDFAPPPAAAAPPAPDAAAAPPAAAAPAPGAAPTDAAPDANPPSSSDAAPEGGNPGGSSGDGDDDMYN